MALGDSRYSITLEHCGYVRRRWVVRFDGSWIGTAKNRADADRIKECHMAARRMRAAAATGRV